MSITAEIFAATPISDHVRAIEWYETGTSWLARVRDQDSVRILNLALVPAAAGHVLEMSHDDEPTTDSVSLGAQGMRAAMTEAGNIIRRKFGIEVFDAWS